MLLGTEDAEISPVNIEALEANNDLPTTDHSIGQQCLQELIYLLNASIQKHILEHLGLGDLHNQANLFEPGKPKFGQADPV